jgi:hypothetical protein
MTMEKFTITERFVAAEEARPGADVRLQETV